LCCVCCLLRRFACKRHSIFSFSPFFLFTFFCLSVSTGKEEISSSLTKAKVKNKTKTKVQNKKPERKKKEKQYRQSGDLKKVVT